MKNEVPFISGGVACAAWHVPATTDRLQDKEASRPCVILGPGLGGTRDTGLPAYAEEFARAGIDAFVFDYRGFGDSDGVPRQDVSARRQRQDYRAAVAATRRLPGVDPERVAVWGASNSGGHVFAVAAVDPTIAAVVSMTPATDGLAVLRQALRESGPAHLVRLTGHGMWDLVSAPIMRAPHYVPLVGSPGTTALMTVPGAVEALTSMSGSAWLNQVRARAALRVAFNRPVRFAHRLVCPILIQVGVDDRLAPPAAARRAAAKARACADLELREYPVDHFDVYDPHWQPQMVADQITFLRRVLAPKRLPRSAPDS